MLHLGCAITVAITEGDHRAESTAEIVLALDVGAKIETSDVDTLEKEVSGGHSNNQYSLKTYCKR